MSTETQEQTVVTPAGPVRTSRPTRTGVVTSVAREKTIRVTVSYKVRHRKYGKFIRRRTVLHAHDEKNEARKGDIVEVMQCRPLSKTKSWRLARVVRQSPMARGTDA